MKLGNYQILAFAWLCRCFGKEIARNKRERAFRFGEEAIELLQASELSKDDVINLVNYVYSREIGDPVDEIGGAIVCLTVLAEVHNVDLEMASEHALQKCEVNSEKIRTKGIAKPVNIRGYV